MREIAWKLADRTLVYCDWEGFREMALPGDLPGGVLRWVSRLLTTLGFSTAWWWVPYVGGGLLLGLTAHLVFHGRARWRWLPLWLAAGFACSFFPLVTTGNCIWTEPESAIGMFRTLGLTVALVLFAGLRRVASRKWVLPVAALAGGALLVPLAAYPLYAVFAHAVRSLFRRGSRCVGVLALAVLTATVPLVCRFVYDDISVDYAMAWANGVRFQLSFEDVSRHLGMERMVSGKDWKGIVRSAREGYAQGKDISPMENAYRILAEYRLGRLPDALFEVPVLHFHLDGGRLQLKMGGYRLLFNCGFLLPARRQIYELVSANGWSPTYYRYLGDIAALLGENALAYRNYTQLARCPFHGDFARRRLQALNDPNHAGLADLAEVVAMARVWNGHYAKTGQLFMPEMLGAETFIYDKFTELKAAPPLMVGMFLSAVLLNGQGALLFENFKMLDIMYPPPRPWPVPVQEALLIHADIFEAEGRGKDLPHVRPGAIAPETVERYRRYLAAIRQAGEHPDREAVRRVVRDFGDTYWCYDWLACPRNERKVAP